MVPLPALRSPQAVWCSCFRCELSMTQLCSQCTMISCPYQIRMRASLCDCRSLLFCAQRYLHYLSPAATSSVWTHAQLRRYSDVTSQPAEAGAEAETGAEACWSATGRLELLEVLALVTSLSPHLFHVNTLAACEQVPIEAVVRNDNALMLLSVQYNMCVLRNLVL